MSCQKSKFLSAYLDNELQDADKTALQAHLPGCGICSAALSEMQALRSAFVMAERHAAPLGFAARVTARAAELDKKKSPWFIPFAVRFTEAAALVVVIMVGILAGRIVMNGQSFTPAANIASSFSLDLFDATPQGSLDGAYLAMTEARNEN